LLAVPINCVIVVPYLTLPYRASTTSIMLTATILPVANVYLSDKTLVKQYFD